MKLPMLHEADMDHGRIGMYSVNNLIHHPRNDSPECTFRPSTFYAVVGVGRSMGEVVGIRAEFETTTCAPLYRDGNGKADQPRLRSTAAPSAYGSKRHQISPSLIDKL